MKKFLTLSLPVLLISTLSFADALENAKTAIRKKNVAALEKMLESGQIDANMKTERGMPLLTYAVRQGYWENDGDSILGVVRVLIQHQANPNSIYDDHGRPESPLTAAILMGKPNVADYLIHAGANVNQQFCYKTKPALIDRILQGEKPHMAFGTVLDLAYARLNQGVDVSAVKSIIEDLQDQKAVRWDSNSMHCDDDRAQNLSVADGRLGKGISSGSDAESKAINASKSVGGAL